jgi:hypothetical protein
MRQRLEARSLCNSAALLAESERVVPHLKTFMLVHRRGYVLLVLACALSLSKPARAQTHSPGSGETGMTVPGLTVSEVVARLVQKNAERATALERYQGTRSYRLDYVGFPENLHAEMIVDVDYKAPDSKEFKVVSESGSKWVINHILKRLLETEHEALESANRERTTLNTQNYDFTMVANQSAGAGCSYVLTVQPKVPNKFVYRGRIWVDAKDFAVCQIEAEPAENPSFWIRHTDIHHAYLKVGDFWFPAENKSVSTLRLGGRATLTIEYKDYKILEARPLRQTDSLTSSAPKPAN